MERAAEIRMMPGFVERRLGVIDTRLLRRVLGDRMSLADRAALQGKSGEKGLCCIASRVRDALEELAEALAVKGKAQPAAADAYRAAADGITSGPY